MGALRELGQTLDQIPDVSHQDAFLISDLLTSRITVLTAEPKAGKTFLAVAMATALINGDEEFLHLPVLRRLDQVVFGVTDDGAEEELKARFKGQVPDESVTVFPVAAPHDVDKDAYWRGIIEDLSSKPPGLFVLDNVLGFLRQGEDIASGVTAQRVIAQVKQVSALGIPSLLITHTAKASAEGFSTASSPMGGRAFSSGARGVIAIRKAKEGLRLATSMNRATTELSIPVRLSVLDGTEVPVWSSRADASPPRESAAVRNRLRAQKIVDGAPPDCATQRSVALWLAHREGQVATGTIIKEVIRPFIEYIGGTWSWKTEALATPPDGWVGGEP